MILYCQSTVIAQSQSSQKEAKLDLHNEHLTVTVYKQHRSITRTDNF